MVGETNLDVLLSAMTAKLINGAYVFVTLIDQAMPMGVNPRMMFEEAEGTTLILLRDEAEEANFRL